MAKMAKAHTLEYNKDPLTDRGSQVDAMKGFKGSSYPKNPFKDAKPRTSTDEAYTPFKARVAR